MLQCLLATALVLVAGERACEPAGEGARLSPARCAAGSAYSQAAAPQQQSYGHQQSYAQQPPYGQAAAAGMQAAGLQNGAFGGPQAGQQPQQSPAAYDASQPYNQQGLTAVQQAQSLLASLQALQPQQPAQPQASTYVQAGQGYGQR